MKNIISVAILALFALCDPAPAETTNLKGRGWHYANEADLLPRVQNIINAQTENSNFTRIPSIPTASPEAVFQANLGGFSSMSMVGNEADEITPEITELARGLQNDPIRIFAYCSNHIDYEHYFGSKKGATMTLIEGSGNAFDICSLMVALLRASGYAAEYRYGTALFFDDELSNWWGLLDQDDLTQEPYPHIEDQDFKQWAGIDPSDPRDIRTLRFITQRVLYSFGGGFPAIQSNYAGDDWAIPHVWVRYTDGGTTYEVDPSFKGYYDRPAKVDVTLASGYNKTTLLNEVTAGSSSGSAWVRRLNETNLDSRLTTYSSNLVSWIKSNDPNATVDEFLGLRSPVRRTYDTINDIFPVFYQEGIPWLPTVQTWPAIPAQWMSRLNVTIGQYDQGTNSFTGTEFDGSLNLPGLKGRKIALSFNGNTASLELDDAAWATANVSGADVEMRLVVDHPHGFYDIDTGAFTDDGTSDQEEVVTYQKADTNYYAILYGFESRGRLIRKRQEILDQYVRDGLASDSKEVVTETLNIMGLNWMLQTQLSTRLVTSQFDVINMNHHRFGRMAQEDGFYVDVGLQFSRAESYISDGPRRDTALQLDTFYGSALEHALIEQFQGSDKEGISTVKIMQVANDQDRRVYLATPSNWSSVRNALSSDYSNQTLDKIEDFIVEDDANVLLPEAEDITLNDWTGTGYAAISDSKAAMIISGDLMGGYLTQPGFVDFESIIDFGYADPAYWDTGSTDLIYASEPITTPSVYGLDPVDLATGAFVYDKTDLEIGKTVPRGLVFKRHYSSNRRLDDSAGLGYGWTHNLNIFITERSAIKSGLGETTPVHMAPYMAAVAASIDLFGDSSDVTEWQTTALVAKWAIDQLIQQGVSVHLGHQVIEFIRHPDGTFVGPAGVNLTLTRNGNRYELSERHGNTYYFNEENKLETIVDLYGKTATFRYNDNGTLNDVKDCYGRQLDFRWENDVIERIEDSTGRNVNFNYDDGNLVTANDADGNDWDFVYDAEHRITELRDPKNRIITQNIYDSRSRVIEQNSEGDAVNKKWKIYYLGQETIEENPEGNQTTHLFDERGRSTGKIDALGNRSLIAYDGQDHIILSVAPEGYNPFFPLGKEFTFDSDNNLTGVEDETGESRTNVYDAQHRLVEEGDNRQNSVEYTYNPQHQVLTIEDGKNNIIQTNTYNSNGELETVTDAGGHTTTYSYDSFGNVNRIDYPDTTFETFVYNTRGDLTSHTDRRNLITTHTYNKRRLLRITTHPDTSTTVNTYDSCGNLETRTDNNGNTTSFTYSATRKLLNTTLPTTAAGTPVLNNIYDDRDWLIRQEDPFTESIHTVYDAAGRSTSITDPLTRSTTFAYDGNARLTSTTNAETESTSHTYNLRGDKLSTTDALLQTIDYAFDANGNRTQIENRREFDFDFDYDANNRMIYSRTPLGFETNQNWNPRSLLDWVEEPSGQTTTFLYDSMGRLDSKTDPVGTVDYGYDNNGNLTTVTEGAVTISRGYDNRNRVTSYTDALGNTYGYQYDGNGNLTSLTYPGGKTVGYEYNPHNQLIKITDWNSRETDYSYDLKGRLTSISRPNGTVRSLQYDAADQVTRIEERKADGSLILLFSFQYDQAGRITEEFAGPLPKEYTPLTYSATYDADNRLATFNGNPVFHDNDGNMTVGPLLDDTLKTYSYDARNRLKSVGGVTYAYDAEGNRISSTKASGTTSYAIDPNTGLSKLLVRTKPDGSKTYYVYGMGLVYEVDESENTHSYHYDYRGSTRFLTDDGESITDSVEYSPYGLVTNRTGNTDTPFLYNGAFGVMAEANGLYHMRARFYNPYTRRFVNPDPIGFSGGMNWYVYANANPVIFNDPEGEIANFIIGGAIGGGLDYAFQVGTNLAQGQSLGNSLRNVDIGSILISTGTGALTGGLSGVLVKQTGKLAVSNATRVGLNTVGNASINAGGAAGGQVVRNFSGGRELDTNIGEAIAFGFVTGGAGSLIGQGAELGINRISQSISMQSFQSAPLSQRLLAISNGLDIPTNNIGAPYGTVVGSVISNQPINPFIGK